MGFNTGFKGLNKRTSC